MRKILPVLFLLAFLALSPVFAQKLVWKTEEGPIFSDPSFHNPEVILLPDGRYRAFYHVGQEMRSAISEDGRSFTLEEGKRLDGAMPALIQIPDSRWRMFYQTTENGVAVFKSALSSDTLTWTVEEGTRLTTGGENDPDSIVHPTVVSIPVTSASPEGGYRMYYDGETRKTEQDFSWRILSASSTDGLTWTKDSGVRIELDEAPLYAFLAFSSHAEYDQTDQLYRLYFSVQTEEEGFPNGIYEATSADGLTFTISEEPLVYLTEERPEAEGVPVFPQDPFVLDLAEGKRMYYWLADTGTLSAALTEEEPAPAPGFWERLGLPKIELKLPENWELFIVPAVILTLGGALLAFLWKKR